MSDLASQLETARAALVDAEARLKDIARLSNGENEEIYQRAYYGNQTRALREIAEGAPIRTDWAGGKVDGYPWQENHSFLPKGMVSPDNVTCARCGNSERDQIHNGSLA
jgi:hypothetical protein